MVRVIASAVAVLFLGGCGVGADEDPALVTSTEAALVQEAASGQQGAVTATTPLRDPGVVLLPQDPIPVHGARVSVPTSR